MLMAMMNCYLVQMVFLIQGSVVDLFFFYLDNKKNFFSTKSMHLEMRGEVRKRKKQKSGKP